MGYIDPEAFGLVSQIGYVALFAVVSIFVFFFEGVKRALRRLPRLGRRAAKPEGIVTATGTRRSREHADESPSED